MLAGSAEYARNRPSAQLFGSALTYFRYIHPLERIAVGSQNAQLGVGIRLPRQGTLQITQAAAYSPSYLYQLFSTGAPVAPGGVIPVNPEYPKDQTESYSYDTRMSAAFGSPRGTRLTTSAEYSRTDFTNRAVTRPTLAAYAAGARVSRTLSRTTGLAAGYEYSAGEFSLGGLMKAHRVTMGVEYSPALSVTRRATLRLDVSPTVFDVPESALIAAVLERPAPGAVERRRYAMQGEAGIDYPFFPKWRAEASYYRSLDYGAVPSEPVLADGVRVRLIGLVGRRIEVSGLATYATAVSAISQDTRKLSSYTGEARIRYALTRGFAVYSEYLYYYYDDPRGQARLAAGLPSVYRQRGIRVGFMLFAQPLD
jgi:hypothetical protein